jgi:hypothetical protein
MQEEERWLWILNSQAVDVLKYFDTTTVNGLFGHGEKTTVIMARVQKGSIFSRIKIRMYHSW